MQGPFKFWKVLDKRRLLLALMDELAGGAYVSFEGDLQRLKLLSIPGASGEPTTALKRNTLWPKQDFVVVPLEPSMERQIIAAIGGTVPAAIIHIQIEKHGQLQFGAYDNFYPSSIYLGSEVKEDFIKSLISQNIMRPYTERRPRREIKS
jgi:hypothetical protein